MRDFDIWAEIGAVLGANPDNAQFVTVLDGSLLVKTVLPALQGK